MKKLVIAMAVLGSMAAFAEGVNVYTKVGGAFIGTPDKPEKEFFFNKNTDDTTADIKKETKLLKGYNFNVEVTKEINDNVELGAGLGYIVNSQVVYDYKDTNSKAIKLKALDTDQVPLYATAKMNFKSGDFKPYAKLDLGYSFNTNFKNFSYEKVDTDATDITTTDKNEKVDKKTKGGLYAGVAVGVEYNNFIAEVAGKYAGYNICMVVDKVNVNTEANHKNFNGHFSLGLNLGYKFAF